MAKEYTTKQEAQEPGNQPKSKHYDDGVKRKTFLPSSLHLNLFREKKDHYPNQQVFEKNPTGRTCKLQAGFKPKALLVTTDPPRPQKAQRENPPNLLF